MATSPIYNWPEPDNTDLVKNGALAIRTLGNAIDTTMATMVPKTIVDAKGDLIAGTAADTTSRLAVGNNGETLVADSSTATGLKWVPNSGPTFLARRNSNQTTTSNAFTKIQFDGELFDTANCYDATTNYRFTPNVEGYYQFNVGVTSTTLAGEGYASIFKNGSEYWQLGRRMPQGEGSGGSIIIAMNGSTDYTEVFFYGTALSTGVEGAAQFGCYFSGTWIRSL